MAVRLLAPDPKPVEHMIEGGPFDGCTLYARRPTYADQLAWTMARDRGERLAERLKLITGWKGAGDDPSPFVDDKDTPVAFTEANFTKACGAHPALIEDAIDAAVKASTWESIEGKSEGPSQESRAVGPSTTSDPPTP
jgi:hypothetical protein